MSQAKAESKVEVQKVQMQMRDIQDELKSFRDLVTGKEAQQEQSIKKHENDIKALKAQQAPPNRD